MKKNRILNNILNKILPHYKSGNILGDNSGPSHPMTLLRMAYGLE